MELNSPEIDFFKTLLKNGSLILSIEIDFFITLSFKFKFLII